MHGQRLAFGPFVLNPEAGTLLRQQTPVAISHRGLLLLVALAERHGEVVTKSELMDAAWPGTAVEESNLSVQIAAIRKLLGSAPDGAEWIVTVPRVGYRFTGEVASLEGAALLPSLDKAPTEILPVRKMAALMVSDVVAKPAMTERGLEQSEDSLAGYQTLVSEKINLLDGRVFKTVGDAAFAEFPSALSALRAAVEIRSALAGAQESSTDRLRMQFGLHIADVYERGDELVGHGIDLTARIQAAAEPDSIYLSGDLFAHVRRNSAFLFDDIGERTFKGTSEVVQLYRVRGERIDRRLTTILAADVAGYSRLMGADESATLIALKAHLAELFFPWISEQNGRVVKTTGDGLLAEFASVVGAVHCALAVQRGMAQRNAAVPEDKRLQFRIGINLGDVIVDGDDLYGDGVNQAARLEGLAEPGGICISRAARDQVRDKLTVTFVDLGDQSVKNIARPIRAFRVLDQPDPAAATIQKRRAVITPSRRWAPVLAGILVLLAIAGSVTWLRPWQTAEAPSVRPGAVSSKPSIAVLPFTNISGNQEQEYFADGLTDDLITQLSRISDLLVIARSSVFTYKGKAVRVGDVARDLGVAYILEGSVRRVGNDLRINAQLVDAKTGHHLWADHYNRRAADVFAIQDEVIAEIIANLAIRLSDAERQQIARIPTTNLEAYDYYLRAETEGYYRTEPQTLQRAMAFYAKAVELDPKLAEAYAGYARVMVEAWRADRNELIHSAVARGRAYDAAGKALSLDPQNSRAYTALAILQLVDKRHTDAIQSARKAIQLNPNDAEAYANLGLVLSYSGELDEAVVAIDRALLLNPAPAPGFQLLAGITFYNARRYERAIEALEQVRSAWPEMETGLEHLAAAYAQAGKLNEAQQTSEALRKPFPIACLGYFQLLYDYYKREEDLSHHLEGLKKAGIPEWPFGFAGLAEDRIVGSDLRALAIARTWSGKHFETDAPFVQQIDAQGRVAYRSSNSFLTGVARINNDMLCITFEGYFQNRELCGPIYRNAAAVKGEDRDYLSVLPESLRYFSPES